MFDTVFFYKHQEWKEEKDQRALEEAGKKLLAEMKNGEETGEITGETTAVFDVLKEQDKKHREAKHLTVVALESTEDYTDYRIGFYTYQYQDGREGVRYRLVTIGENGLLEAYPETGKFFINRDAATD